MTDPTIQQLFDLTGKVALITGGAHNLGRDMTCALAEAGADVAITGRSLEAAQKSATASLIQSCESNFDKGKHPNDTRHHKRRQTREARQRLGRY
jgi:NAD(P)-dependent dehydrogenase (short-subunit alcohol dehydrogenase family)